MKLHFQNLGTFEEATVELGSLTAIIGPNNTSKTYLAYVTYGLLKRITKNLLDIVPTLPGVTLKEHESVLVGEYTTQAFEAMQEHVLSECDSFTGELTTFFQDSSRKLFPGTTARISDYSWKDLISSPVLQQNGIQHEVADNETCARFSIRLPSVKAKFGTPIDKQKQSAFETDVSSFLAKRRFSRSVIQTIFPTPFPLPAERKTLTLVSRYLANERLKILRDLQRQSLSDDIDPEQLEGFSGIGGEIGFPEPVEDFLEFLGDLGVVQRRRSNQHPELLELAETIERRIHGGQEIEFRKNARGDDQIRLLVEQKLSIDMHNASSSVKQLTPLVMYLRYKATPGDLLVIDEPEMNLHPTSQVQLLEVLSMMTRCGVRVLLTTHSPYLLAHLTNLIQAEGKSEEWRKANSSKLYLGDSRAFISGSDVRAYEVKNKRLVSLKDEDYGIRWTSLGDVFSDLQERFFSLQEE